MNFEERPFFSFGQPRNRMKRGLLPFILLRLLSERPRHGYDFMREFKERGGHWRPGGGSIYPALSALEEAGFVQSRDEDGKRVYVITEQGLEHLKHHGAGAEDLLHNAPSHKPPHPVAEAMHKLHAAAQQAAQGNPQLVAAVTAVLNGARKEIYTLLANE
ncbi:MAG: PadR family transcriptional regulator [Candidatus Eremiobacteraeota bacterium]|nr:PadR family transcriptional regulator [Candidatus Eremiobacteraeota bacterium]